MILVPELISSLDDFKKTLPNGDKGSVRVALVRKHFGLHYVGDSRVKAQIKPLKPFLNDIIDLHVNWRDTVEIMPIRYVFKKVVNLDLKKTPVDPDKWINEYNIRTSKMAVRFNELSDIVVYEIEDPEWVRIKSCKRGNDVYTRRVKEKFDTLIKWSKSDECKNKIGFSIRESKNRNRVKKTNLLLVSGTCDHKITGSIGNSWLKFGGYWNSFITNVREKFHGCEFIRCWQSQENGYPHFHALIYFPNYKFTVVKKLEWSDRKQKEVVVWRIHNRQQLNHKPAINQIVDCWKEGSIDVRAVSSLKEGLTEVLKYVTRDLIGGESELTNAMVWYFGNQSYSISKNFVKSLTGKTEKELCIDLAEPSNADLIKAEGFIQRSNSKKNLVRIEVFPLIPLSFFPDFKQKRVENYEDPPSLPPPVVDFLDRFADSCRPVKLKEKKLSDGSVVDVVVYDYDNED